MQIAVYAVEFLQKGLAPPLGDRGLALPLLLALAPEGQILIGLPLLFWLQLLGIVLLISGQLSREKPKSAVRIGAIIGTAAVFAALPITWVAATYINSHVLVALCLGVSVHLLVKGSKQFQIDRQDRILLILALASLSMARPDGLFFAFVVLIFLMGMPLQEGPRPKVWILVTMLVFSLVFSPGIELGSALGPSGSLFLTSTMVGAGALSWALRDYLSGFVISSIAMLLAVGALVTFFLQTNMDLVDAVSPQLRNLALGAGGWGLFFPLLIVLLVATQLGNTGRQRAHILDLLLSLVLVLVTLKILSGGGIGNQGFNDSINRSLLHFLPLLVPVTFVAIEELGVRISSVYSPRNRGENA